MTTLSILKTSVDAWLIRDDIAVSGTDFPQILLLAESDIARDVHCVMQETSADIVFTGRSADLPANYMQERNPFIDDNVRNMSYLTPKAIKEGPAWNDGRVGAFYTLEGGGGSAGDERVKMIIAGPASVTTPLTVTVNYIARFAPLVNAGDTNWLLKNHFDVYLYATLRAAAEMIQEDMLEDRYAAKYERAAARTNLAENRRRVGMSPKYASNSPRTTV